MDETSKTRKIWSPRELAILSGKGIDIGCGPDPVTPDVRKFDLEHGDANVISQHISEQFDFVYASHCLEHMHQPAAALLDWWKLVKPGGHLFFLVPDEDLYEQGVFPSRFNPDHKATFTISKRQSWSPVSQNVLALASSLPAGQLVSLELHDHGYDRRLMKHGHPSHPPLPIRILRRAYRALQRFVRFRSAALEEIFSLYMVSDQTLKPDALAQIQCIVKKLP